MKKTELCRLGYRSMRAVVSHLTLPSVVRFVAVWLYDGVSFGLTAPLLQKLLDAVTASAGTGAGFISVLGFGLLYAAAETSRWVSVYLYNVVYAETFRCGISQTMTEEMNRKTGRLEPVCFDDPKTLDIIDKASKCLRSLFGIFDIVLRILLSRLVPLGIIVVYLYSLDPILCLLPLLTALPIAFTELAGVGFYTRFEERAAPLRREAEAYLGYAGSREAAKETRTLGAVPYFRALYESVLTAMNRELYRADGKRAGLTLCGGLISLFGFGASLFLLIRLTAAGTIGLGAFAAVFASLNRIFSLMEALVIYDFARLIRELPTAQAYFDFMALPERNGSGETPGIAEGIRAEHIRFRYPGRDADAVADVSFEIRAGETLAIVGENGSGKSTLVKLLLGLYLPQEGRITYDGHDISAYSGASLVRNTSAVFQDFQRYKLSLKDNAAISDLERAERVCGFADTPERLLKISPSDAVTREITASLASLGVDTADAGRFPDGVETVLAREFGGIDLSGGQWQKVAIARGLFRRHTLIALDEPTAAIDPLEETRLYRRFAEISRGKTALLVTHRLGSVWIADRILVMDKGRIVQEGRHEELMRVPGRYREMWEAQAAWYQSETADAT